MQGPKPCVLPFDDAPIPILSGLTADHPREFPGKMFLRLLRFCFGPEECVKSWSGTTETPVDCQPGQFLGRSGNPRETALEKGQEVIVKFDRERLTLMPSSKIQGGIIAYPACLCQVPRVFIPEFEGHRCGDVLT